MNRAQRFFEENFSRRGEVGAAVSVWLQGKEILHLSGGTLTRDGSTPWTAETVAPVWSATKGPAALSLLLTLHEAGLDPGAPVRSVWPQLSLPLTFAELLSHQSGLPALDAPPSVFDREAVIAALEQQTPAWPPGTAHGYHPRTSGFLWDECVRRLTGGSSLGEVWKEKIADPLLLDFWIGAVPETRHSDVARLYPGRAKPPHPDEAAFFAAMSDPQSLTRRAFLSPAGLHSVDAMNQPDSWAAGLPAFGGVGSARALGTFYAVLANGGRLGDRQIVPVELLSWLETPLADGMDRVLLLPTAFSAGFMMDPTGGDGRKLTRRFGPSLRAFGQPGAGGSHAFADPARGLSFAYVMNQMETGVLPNEKSLGLIEAVLEDLDH